MKVLVTGGAGFIGSHLVDSLLLAGHEVLVVDDFSTGKREYINKQASFLDKDIRDDDLKSIFEDFSPDLVYHLAAQKNVRTSLENPVLDADINIKGALNVLMAAIDSQVEKFVFVSTCGIYGNTENLPTDEQGSEDALSPYILNKLSFEKYLKILAQDKIKWAALRLSNVYGPRQDPYGEAGVIAIFLDNALRDKVSYINGDGLQTRDFIYVADVVSALLKIIDKGEGIYNVGTGRESTLLDILDNIKNISNKEVKTEHKDAIAGEVKRSCLDSSKIKNELAWQSDYDLKQGLELTYRWFKEEK